MAWRVAKLSVRRARRRRRCDQRFEARALDPLRQRDRPATSGLMRAERRARGLDFGLPDGVGAVHDLALQVGEVHLVVVAQRDAADAAGGQIERRPASPGRRRRRPARARRAASPGRRCRSPAAGCAGCSAAAARRSGRCSGQVRPCVLRILASRTASRLALSQKKKPAGARPTGLRLARSPSAC